MAPPGTITLPSFDHPLWDYCRRRGIRYAASWILVCSVAGALYYHSMHGFDEPKRPDGNYGHCTIDFGGQYLMGRMLVRGYGRHLYHRSYQRQVLTEVYPPEDQEPRAARSDVE